MRHWLTLLLLFCSAQTWAADPQGIGMFQTLDKPWFVVALYADGRPDDDGRPMVPQKLELRVVEDSISVRRYRKLWQDVFAVAQEREVWQTYAGDLQAFFQLIKGPLEMNDQLVIEQRAEATVVSINYREHAVLSPGFLPLLVNTLTARIAPVPELRNGLLGELPEDETRSLMRQFDKSEPTLGRISETARWLRRSAPAVTEARLSQL